jgi:AcrR family transcriptional regulator
VRTKERLLDAAAALLHKKGLSHLSTREVASAAGVAEGAMYHHFEDKSALLLAVIEREGPTYFEELRMLPTRVGTRTVKQNLIEVGHAFYAFQRGVIPITCSLFADVPLLERHRKTLRQRSGGPAATRQLIATYVAAEQRIGRIPPKLKPDALATLLMGGCFQLAFAERYMGPRLTATSAKRSITGLIDTLVR